MKATLCAVPQMGFCAAFWRYMNGEFVAAPADRSGIGQDSLLRQLLKAESDEIVAAVKKKNGVAEYVVFADEGHGFMKKENEIRAYKAILDFLDEHLRGHGPAQSSSP